VEVGIGKNLKNMINIANALILLRYVVNLPVNLHGGGNPCRVVQAAIAALFPGPAFASGAAAKSFQIIKPTHSWQK
jgi:hypothetical protein